MTPRGSMPRLRCAAWWIWLLWLLLSHNSADGVGPALCGALRVHTVRGLRGIDVHARGFLSVFCAY